MQLAGLPAIGPWTCDNLDTLPFFFSGCFRFNVGKIMNRTKE